MKSKDQGRPIREPQIGQGQLTSRERKLKHSILGSTFTVTHSHLKSLCNLERGNVTYINAFNIRRECQYKEVWLLIFKQTTEEGMYLFNATIMKIVKIFLEFPYLSITLRAEGKFWSLERGFE